MAISITMSVCIKFCNCLIKRVVVVALASRFAVVILLVVLDL